MTPRRQTISGPRRRTLDILVVEDCAGTELVLGMAFERLGCVVRTARSVTEADEAIRHAVPDVVVCGLEHESDAALRTFAEQLRDVPRTCHVGRVALTDRRGWARDAQAAFEVQLQKRPLHLSTLLVLVEELAISGRLLRRGGR